MQPFWCLATAVAFLGRHTSKPRQVDERMSHIRENLFAVATSSGERKQFLETAGAVAGTSTSQQIQIVI